MALKKSAASTIKNIYNKAKQNYSSKVSGSKSLLYNKYVLYATVIICFMTVLGWLFSKEFVPVIVFLLVGYLTTFFSKNMIVILVIAFVVSNVMKVGTHVVLEGMEGNEDKKKVKEGAANKKEKMSNKNKPNNSSNQEGMNEENENGMNEENENGSEHENEDENMADEKREATDELPCTVDSDCIDGRTCDKSRFVCVAK